MYYFINLGKIRQLMSFFSPENQNIKCSPSNGVKNNYIMSSCARDPTVSDTRIRWQPATKQFTHISVVVIKINMAIFRSKIILQAVKKLSKGDRLKISLAPYSWNSGPSAEPLNVTRGPVSLAKTSWSRYAPRPGARGILLHCQS